MADKDSGIYMETTKKDPEDTIADIKKILKNYGLTKFNETYENGEMSGCIFGMTVMGKELPFKLPINWKPLLEKADRGETKYLKPGDKIQAQRVAWRQVLRWVEAQFALIDLGMAEVQEVFLPYIMISKTKTIFEQIAENGYKLLEDDHAR